MDPQYALVGGAACFVLQLAGRIVAAQPYAIPSSLGGAGVFVVVLLLAPGLGGVAGSLLIALAVVALLLAATIRPDQFDALRRRFR
jgi:hypothetical protein